MLCSNQTIVDLIWNWCERTSYENLYVVGFAMIDPITKKQNSLKHPAQQCRFPNFVRSWLQNKCKQIAWNDKKYINGCIEALDIQKESLHLCEDHETKTDFAICTTKHLASLVLALDNKMATYCVRHLSTYLDLHRTSTIQNVNKYYHIMQASI